MQTMNTTMRKNASCLLEIGTFLGEDNTKFMGLLGPELQRLLLTPLQRGLDPAPI
jgi:hypothetical protein